ncbi:MAG: tetratricopeptide (TPR) repeat protein, partial [Myxococcota bacterium]
RSALVRLADGRGGALTPCGEVGIGKSRLLREIRALADRSDIPCFVARCDGVSSDRPYEPFRDLVLSMLGVDPGAPAATAADQSSRLTSVGLTPREVEAVGALLGSASKNPPGPQEIRDALQRLCLSMARSGPFILCLDDVHNLAPTDRELLDRLLAGLRKAPILFLLTWDGAPSSKAPGQLVRLAALTAENQSRLTCDLLLCTQIGERLGSLIRETCEGNPLYVEEMVAFLTERGSLRVEGGEATLVADSTEPLPPGLAALVAARIDALAPAAKGALQLAAVIGARFDAQILAEAAGVDDTTLLCLDLEAHGLIARASETQWAFSSHLVQQAALRGALGVQRRDYHRMVAQAIERCFPQDLAPWREDLLVHCAEGGRPVDAARYAFAAGQELEREQFLEQARAVYRRGVTTLRAADSDTSTYDARVQGEAMLTSRIGVVSHVLGDTADGDRSLRLALDIASDVGLPWIEVRAHVELGKSYAQRGSAARANAHLSQALALLEHAPDPAIEVEILEAQAELAFDSGRNAQAESLWELALARAADDPAAEARCQLGLGNRFIRSGDHDRAGPLLEAALVASLEAGDRILEGRVLNNIGLVHSYAGRTDRALEYYRRALTVRAGIGYVRGVAINHHNIGDTHFHAGQWPQAWVAFSRSRELACEMAWDRGVVLNDVYLAYLSASQSGGGADDVLEATDRALALGDHEIASTGAWLAGRLLLERGDRTAAHDQLHQALSLAKDWGLTPMIRDLEQLLSAPAPAPP